jgi:hypothetical protein
LRFIAEGGNFQNLCAALANLNLLHTLEISFRIIAGPQFSVDLAAKIPGLYKIADSKATGHFNWLSLLPRRLKPVEVVCRFSRSDWQLTHSRTPGIALRRASGITVSHSSQWVEPSPSGNRLLASFTASSTLASI